MAQIHACVCATTEPSRVDHSSERRDCVSQAVSNADEDVREWALPVVRILIVDDLDLWLGFVTARLREQTNLRIVGLASDGLDGVQQARVLQPDLVLLDIDLPRLNGLEAARQIQKVAPESKILFLTAESAPEIVEAAFRVGGSGYVSKIDAATQLLAGIEAILQGKRFVSPSLIES